jgi:hypothetical protein
MNDTITANLNNTSCLVTKNHFGYDTVINICTGNTQDIPWAFGDWAGVVAIGSFGALMAIFMIALAVMFIKLILEDF